MANDMNLQNKFIFYASKDGDLTIKVYVEDENIWVTQAGMTEIFDVAKSTISEHLSNIFKEGELVEDSVVRIFRTTASDGKTYSVAHYNLDAIISVGYRVNSYKATQFRIWATSILKEFLVKGFAMDDERLKQGKTLFGKDYFDELLDRIREIRASEKRLYLKVTGIYEECSYDYDVNSPITKNFFANGMLVHNCPYYEEDKAPVGLPCLVEVNLLHFYTTQYLNEFDVDPSRITEMHLVGELAELDIYEMRSTKLIAEKYPTMISDVVMGFDSEGTPLINEDISKVFDLKERLKKSRMKILETLMATRKERVKSAIAAAGVGEVRTISSLYDKLESIKVSMSSMKESRSGDIIDGEAEEV